MRSGCLHNLERYEEEFAVYQKLENQGFADAFLYSRMGRVSEKMEHMAEAETYFRQSLEKDSTYGRAWDGLGDILQNQGRWDEAIDAYQKGAEYGHLQSARDLCRLLKRMHQTERAEEQINEEMKKWPDDVSLILIYSDVLVQKKEYEKAVRWLNRYIEVRPEKSDMLTGRLPGVIRMQEIWKKLWNTIKNQSIKSQLSPGLGCAWESSG